MAKINPEDFIIDQDILGELPNIKRNKKISFETGGSSQYETSFIEQTETTFADNSFDVSETEQTENVNDARFYGGSKLGSDMLTKSISVAIEAETDGEELSLDIHSEMSEEDKKSISDVSLEYKDGKGSYKTDIDGSKQEGTIDANNYEEFLSKLYATLLMSRNQNSSAQDSSISTSSGENELMIEIEHN